MGRWGGVVSGSYRAPLAAARLSARDCSCMVTQPPSEQSAVSFPPGGRIGDAHSRRAATLWRARFGNPVKRLWGPNSGQPVSSHRDETKNGFLDASADDDKRSACISLQHRIDEHSLRKQIHHESASDPTRRSRASAPLTEGWAAPPPEAPDARSAPLCPGTVPKHPAYRWGARRSSRPRL